MFTAARQRILHYVFRRYFLNRIEELTGNRVVRLDYAAGGKPTYTPKSGGHPVLLPWFENQRSACQETLRVIREHRSDLERIPRDGDDPLSPHWKNKWFSGLDGMTLYALVASRRPRRLTVVGSGNSTKFAARAIRDHRLETTLVSIDPKPRADIDRLCDHVVRSRVEKVDFALFDELEAGDILFIDSSHRVYTSSDVTRLFLEVVPRLRRGVILHVHDIFLPWDYPAEWTTRYYSEQYLLASLLLAQPARFRLLMSSAFASYDPALRRQAREAWSDSPLAFMLDEQFASGGVRGLSGMSLWLDVL